MRYCRKYKKAIVAVLAGLMALLMVLSILASIGGNAFAVTTNELQNQISQLKNQSGDLAAQKKNLTNQLKSIQSDKNKAMEKKMLIERQVEVIRSEIAANGGNAAYGR